MTSDHPAWLDRGLVQTNPVYAAECFRAHREGDFEDPLTRAAAVANFARRLRAMAQLGGRVPDRYAATRARAGDLPDGFRLDGSDGRPGVFGLAADPAFVVPLRPERIAPGPGGTSNHHCRSPTTRSKTGWCGWPGPHSLAAQSRSGWRTGCATRSGATSAASR